MIAIGRQPIFDSKLNTVAYELLFRECDGQNRAAIRDGDQATTEVILTAFTEIGLQNLFNNKPAFLNLTLSFLEGKVPLPNLAGKVVLEVLENIPVTEATVNAVQGLKHKGYTIALDDLVYRSELEPLIDAADIIKLDIQAQDYTSLEASVQRLRDKDKKLLAEKIETHAEFEACQSLGFNYYQGYFFCRPEVLSAKALPTNKLQVMKILSKLYDPDSNVTELADEISQDVNLTFRLLRYVNSAQVSLRKEIESISQAIMLLGWDNIRSIATLLTLSRIDGKSVDLFKTGLIRARMCGLLAPKVKAGAEDIFFTVGLLSILDALLDMPMEQVMQQLPLSHTLQTALVEHEGESGRTLADVIAYTEGRLTALETYQYNMDDLTGVYLQAMQWADATSAQMQEGA